MTICAICDEAIPDDERCVLEWFGFASPLIHCVACWDRHEDVKADDLDPTLTPTGRDGQAAKSAHDAAIASYLAPLNR